MVNIDGEREDPTCRDSVSLHTNKEHNLAKSMHITVFQGLRSRDSCHVQPQGCVLTAKQSGRHGVVEIYIKFTSYTCCDTAWAHECRI